MSLIKKFIMQNIAKKTTGGCIRRGDFGGFDTGDKMTDELKLEMDAYLPLRDVVFKTLRGAILRGELKPGERLMELKLASQLGVSRTPVREAIRMLEQEGLAVTVPRRGAEVAKMTEKDMEDVLAIRIALEDLAMRLSCQNISDEMLDRIKSAMLDFEDKINCSDVEDIARADVEFHELLYEASNNPKLITLLNNLREQIYRYRIEYLKDPETYPLLVEEHRQIYEALLARDEDAAVKHVESHLHNQEKYVKKIISEQ